MLAGCTSCAGRRPPPFKRAIRPWAFPGLGLLSRRSANGALHCGVDFWSIAAMTMSDTEEDTHAAQRMLLSGKAEPTVAHFSKRHPSRPSWMGGSLSSLTLNPTPRSAVRVQKHRRASGSHKIRRGGFGSKSACTGASVGSLALAPRTVRRASPHDVAVNSPHLLQGAESEFWLGLRGAGYRIRTRGPLITNQVLYQLS